MKAVAAETPPLGENWVYELKWDGMRVVAVLDDEGVRLRSSSGNDATASFPELDRLEEVLDGFDSLVLDGEVVAIDNTATPSFSLLQQRMHVSDRTEALRRAETVPISYAIFDVLNVNGTDTRNLPFADRRTLLEQIVEPGSHWRLTDLHEDDPDLLLATVIERGLEGIVAKDIRSRYEPGRRSPNWVKVKPRLRQEFVVGGWSEGRDGNAGQLGSLLLGVMEGDELVHCGSVGSGLDDEARRTWLTQLQADARATPPFSNEVTTSSGRQLHWAEPSTVVEVSFHDWPEGGHLRHPVYLGWRTDKDPSLVQREVGSRNSRER